MFSAFVVVVYELTFVLSVKRWISQLYSHCWNGVKYAEDAVKPKNVQDLEDFSGEMLAVQRLRTHEQLLGLQKGGTFPVNFRNIIEIWETFQDSLESSGILPPFCNPNSYHKI